MQTIKRLTVAEWWAHREAGHTFLQLLSRTEERLQDGMRRYGSAYEEKIAEFLGEEVWLWIARQSLGWGGICEDAQMGSLDVWSRRLAQHLWQVRQGAKLSITGGRREARKIHRYLRQNLGSFERRVSAEIPAGQEIVTGRELAMTLARVLYGDADMTPIDECQNIHVRLSDAVELTQELANQWRENGQTDKWTFKRILTSRLGALMKSPAEHTSGPTRPFDLS